jgi:stage IV sporulation protein FB
MNLPEPYRTRFEIRGRLCGIPLRIQPLFWSSVAVLGIRYYADPEAGSLGYFTFWIVGVLGCVLLHALGQVGIGRFFGMRGEIVLHGLGSQILAVESLSRCWQRIVVLLAGPIVQLLLVGCIWGLTAFPFPSTLSDWGWQTPIATGAVILVRISLAWGLLNILPLWPLAGGRIALDVGQTLLGRTGRVLAQVLSLAVTGILIVWVVLEMSLHLENRYDPGYLMHLEEGIIRLLFCFVLWTMSFKALWPAENTTPVIAQTASKSPRL